MASIVSGNAVMLVGKKGPLDWMAHRADWVVPEGGGVVLTCAIGDKKVRTAGARRCQTVLPEHYGIVRVCSTCWPTGLPVPKGS